MSTGWQAFVDTQLLAKKRCFQACILCAKDGVPWAFSNDFMPRMYKSEIMQEDGTEKEELVNEAVNLVQVPYTL